MRPPTDEPGSGLPNVGAIPSPAVDVHQLLAPVQPGLRKVEVKMKVVDSSLFAPLATAFVDLIGSGGKRVRPALALLAAALHGADAAKPDSAVISLAASVEMLHTATLVHDDVIDGALLRRGAPTLNASWSRGSTVLAGNYMFGRAAYFAAETGNNRLIDIFSTTLQEIVNGELRQLFARYNYEQEKDEYLQRIYAKTASLFCAATEGAGVLSALPEDRIQQLRDFGYNLGMAFQIVDDILDFTADDATLGKPTGSDLLQGTLTLPFFYFLHAQRRPDLLVAHLVEHQTQRGQNGADGWDAAVADIVQELRAGAAIPSARQDAVDFADRAQQNLASFPDSVYRASMLGLCDFVVNRTF